MPHQGKDVGSAPPNPPSGGTSGDIYSPPRLGGYQAQIITEGYEANTYYIFYLVKNIEIDSEGGIKFFHLVHNKRLDNKTQSDESDYPAIEEGENLVQYFQRVEKLPWMEWNMTMLNDYLTLNIRGRLMYYTDDKGNYRHVSEEKLSTKQPDSTPSTVIPMKRS